MSKHTINIRVVVEPAKSVEENKDNLKKTPTLPRNDQLTVETPLSGTNQYDKVSHKDSTKPSQKLIK
jgi:hypothetical protein